MKSFLRFLKRQKETSTSKHIPLGFFFQEGISAEQNGVNGNSTTSAISIEGQDFVIKKPGVRGLMTLLNEGDIYRKLGCQKKIHGFSQIYNLPGLNLKYLVQTVLGKDLWQLCSPVRLLSDETLFSLWEQAIERLEYIHSKGVIHGDISPCNMAMGTGKDTEILHLLEFSNSSVYKNAITGVHKSLETGFALNSTIDFASINTLRGKRQSRRDDLESHFYSMFTLLFGVNRTPWCDPNITERTGMLKLKLNLKTNGNFEGAPASLSLMYTYLSNMEYTENPDYKQLKALVRKASKELISNEETERHKCNVVSEQDKRKRPHLPQMGILFNVDR